METAYEISLPEIKAKLEIVPIGNSTVIITALGVQSNMLIMPLANNAIKISLERYSEK